MKKIITSAPLAFAVFSTFIGQANAECTYPMGEDKAADKKIKKDCFDSENLKTTIGEISLKNFQKKFKEFTDEKRIQEADKSKWASARNQADNSGLCEDAIKYNRLYLDAYVKFTCAKHKQSIMKNFSSYNVND